MKKLHEPIKAILFDFGGTLDSDGTPWKERFYAIYRSLGMRWSEQEFAPLFYYADDALTEQTLNRTRYIPMLQKQVAILFKRAGISNHKIAQKAIARFYQDSLRTLKKNLPTIKKLSQKYKLGIVSNFYGNVPTLIQEVGYAPYFKAVIDSTRIGAIKPDPKIFNAALRKLNVSKEETLFVGDSPTRDMIGAKKMGMRHVRVLTEGRKVKLCCKNDLTVASIRELPQLLEAL